MSADTWSTEPELITVTLRVCDLCFAGAGGECHVPGCAFWMQDAPALALRTAMSREGASADAS